MTGPCAKTTVRCTLVTTAGEHIIGENWCANPQSVCPRAPGEDYTKCATICQQEGHAEAVAVRIAGAKAHGARAYLSGHTYACMACQHAMFGAGVVAFGIGEPPPTRADSTYRAIADATGWQAEPIAGLLSGARSDEKTPNPNPNPKRTN